MSRFTKTFFATIALATSALSTPAFAGWKVAETEHFVYYSEASEEELLEAVKRMETFDTLVRALTNNTRPSNPLKLVMFELSGIDDIARTMPYDFPGVAGYYTSTDKGPFLVTFRENVRTGRNSLYKTSKRSLELGPEVRQHEYLHHYMYQYFNTNYPTWYSEGFAEYYGTMAFPEENVVEIGHAPFGRLDSLKGGSWIPVDKLLVAKSYADVNNLSAFYAQGWLLTHLGAQNPARGKQLQQYLQAVSSGTDYEKAAKDAFGDLKELNKELNKHRSSINAMRLSLKPMNFGDITVRELPDIEDQLMYYKIRLYSGYERSQLALVVKSVREKIAASGATADSLATLAQLEMLDGQFNAAIATADKALAMDGSNQAALVAKGRAMEGKLTPASPAEDWEAPRDLYRQAVAGSKVNPEPRVALFKSYLAQGVMPSIEAQAVMVDAFNLLPQNDEIRYLLARDFEQRGVIEEAIMLIEPAAFGTFDGGDNEVKKRRRALGKAAERYTNINDYESPRDMLKRLEAKRDGTWDEATQSVTSPAS